MSVHFSFLIVIWTILLGFVRWVEPRCHIMSCAFIFYCTLVLQVENVNRNESLHEKQSTAQCCVSQPCSICSAEPSLCRAAVKAVPHSLCLTPSHLSFLNKTQFGCHVATCSSQESWGSSTCKKAFKSNLFVLSLHSGEFCIRNSSQWLNKCASLEMNPS